MPFSTISTNLISAATVAHHPGPQFLFDYRYAGQAAEEFIEQIRPTSRSMWSRA
ncbi:MAG: hypothetical protein U1F00_10890 [Rhodoferax sp.]